MWKGRYDAIIHHIDSCKLYSDVAPRQPQHMQSAAQLPWQKAARSHAACCDECSRVSASCRLLDGLAAEQARAARATAIRSMRLIFQRPNLLKAAEIIPVWAQHGRSDNTCRPRRVHESSSLVGR